MSPGATSGTADPLPLPTLHSGPGVGAGATGGTADPLPPRTLLLVALAAFGGPLALAALYVPAALVDVPRSAGLVTVLGAAAFVAPLLVWLRYAREVRGPAGLAGFVQAAVGRRLALVQAALWTGSYLLYLLYTGAYVVYDLLPVPWPGVHRVQPLLAVALPVAVAAVVVGGRRATFAVIGGFAVAQVAVLGLLDVIAVAHTPTAPSLALSSSGPEVVRAGGDVAALFVCGSLPLFLGGEVAALRRPFGRVLPTAFVVAAAGALLAAWPLAHDPAFLRAAIPGESLARVDVGPVAGATIGWGVAASVVALMLVEYVALTRLLHALTRRSVTTWSRALAVPLVVAGPVSLLGPQRFYDSLLKPSLVLLWLAQLVVVAAYPVFVARRRRLTVVDGVLTAVSVALIGYALHGAVAGAAAS